MQHRDNFKKYKDFIPELWTRKIKAWYTWNRDSNYKKPDLSCIDATWFPHVFSNPKFIYNYNIQLLCTLKPKLFALQLKVFIKQHKDKLL